MGEYELQQGSCIRLKLGGFKMTAYGH